MPAHGGIGLGILSSVHIGKDNPIVNGIILASNRYEILGRGPGWLARVAGLSGWPGWLAWVAGLGGWPGWLATHGVGWDVLLHYWDKVTKLLKDYATRSMQTSLGIVSPRLPIDFSFFNPLLRDPM